MLVKIYFNDVRVEKPYLVHTNCPHIKVRLEDAQAFANMKMAAGEWTRYLIPELCDSVVVFEEFDPSRSGEVCL